MDLRSSANGDPPLAGRVSMLAVHAKSMKGSRRGDPTGCSGIVHLPPSYEPVGVSAFDRALTVHGVRQEFRADRWPRGFRTPRQQYAVFHADTGEPAPRHSPLRPPLVVVR
ncbi:hypothetical protein [Frateuria sp. YIM B11624]|uniref:hypothetical protein n=1 Tax=Frateuria sp. YIM B11624 TaxID=3143185 RepID=UPI003C7654A5